MRRFFTHVRQQNWDSGKVFSELEVSVQFQNRWNAVSEDPQKTFFRPDYVCVCVWVCITFPILHKTDKEKKHTERTQDEGEIKDKKGINLISLELELLLCLACAAQMRKSTIKTEEKSLALPSPENTIAMKKKTKWVFHCRRRRCWCYRNTAFAIKFICHMNSKFVCSFLSSSASFVCLSSSSCRVVDDVASLPLLFWHFCVTFTWISTIFLISNLRSDFDLHILTRDDTCLQVSSPFSFLFLR